MPDDRHTVWTPLGYHHEVCPSPMVDLHPSGFTNKQVYYSKLLIDHIKSGGKVNLVRCKVIGQEDVYATVLCIIGHEGRGIAPIAVMFEGDGTDEVTPIMGGGDDAPPIIGRKTNG